MSEAEKYSSTETPSCLIRESDVKAALQADKGGDAKLISFTVKDFTKKGDNYATIVTSVTATYNFLNNHERNDVSYIVKRLPCRESDVFNDITRVVCRTEARFYQELTPELNSILTSVGEEPLRLPRCVYVNLEEGKEVIFLEDLRVRGFKMFDRRVGLDEAHTRLILQELARLHSASYLLQHSQRRDAVDLKDLFSKDWMNYSENASEFWKGLYTESVASAISVLETVPGYERAVSWLQQLKPKVYEVVMDQIRECGSYAVVCHCDCWTSNVLFRYDESNVPLEVMLLDLQLVRLASPATDINYLLYTSLNASDRRNNYDIYLDTYHNAFKKVIEGEEKLCMPFNRQQLVQECKSKLLYAVILAIVDSPFIIGNEGDVPDVQSIWSDEEKSQEGDVTANILLKSPLIKPRFLATFDEMIEKGVIP